MAKNKSKKNKSNKNIIEENDKIIHITFVDKNLVTNDYSFTDVEQINFDDKSFKGSDIIEVTINIIDNKTNEVIENSELKDKSYKKIASFIKKFKTDFRYKEKLIIEKNKRNKKNTVLKNNINTQLDMF